MKRNLFESLGRSPRRSQTTLARTAGSPQRRSHSEFPLLIAATLASYGLVWDRVASRIDRNVLTTLPTQTA